MIEMVSEADQPRILTIGHSNHPIDRFLDLLRYHRVDVVVDTRSQPYSKYSPQYDLHELKRALGENGFRYVFLGRELGGRPDGKEFYDDDGHVLYSRVAESPAFLEGIAHLESGLLDHRVALLCSEENPAGCHRRLLIGRILEMRGVAVDHILGDGRLQSEQELAAEEAAEKTDNQLALFEYETVPEWKSIPSVSRKKRQSSSSDF
jgi:uncharacterized protein (DUF488 family)